MADTAFCAFDREKFRKRCRERIAARIGYEPEPTHAPRKAATRRAYPHPNGANINREKTHCPQGHPYGGPSADGKRRCRECNKIHQARKKARMKSERQAKGATA